VSLAGVGVVVEVMVEVMVEVVVVIVVASGADFGVAGVGGMGLVVVVVDGACCLDLVTRNEARTWRPPGRYSRMLCSGKCRRSPLPS